MLLFFCNITIIAFIGIIFVVIIILFSDIRLIIKNFQYSNIYKTKENKTEFKIQIYLFGKLKCLSIKIKNNLTKRKANNKSKEYLKIKLEELLSNSNKNNFKNNNTKNIIKYLYKNIKIENLNTEILLDTKSVESTAFLVGIVSTIIPIIIRSNIKKYNRNAQKKYYFKVIPLYQNINVLNIKLNCIFSIKIVHIINMLKLQIKKEIFKYE